MSDGTHVEPPGLPSRAGALPVFRFLPGTTVPDPVLLADAGGTCVFANEAWTQFTGASLETTLGRGWADLVHPADRDAAESAVSGAISRHGWARSEIRIKRRDGDYRSVLQTMMPLADDHGEFAGLLVAHLDVTIERRAAQVAQSRLRLNDLAHHESVDTVIQHALDQAELLTSSEIAFFHFLEADQVTLTLQTWSTNTLSRMCTAEGKGSHYPVEQAGVWADAVRGRAPTIHNDYPALAHRKGLPPGHAPVRSELVVPVMRGDRVVAIMGVGNAPRPYVDEDVGIVSSMADLAYDAAERRRSADALASSEERLRLALQATSDGVWDWNTLDRRLWWSPRLYAMLGYDGSSVTLTPEWTDALIHPEDVARVHEAFRRHMTGEDSTLAVEGRWRAADGTWRWFFTRGQVAARDGHGAPVRVIGTHQDITERQHEEKQRLRMERRLTESQKLESLGVLAGGIAHDFNNLLTVILGNIELVRLDVQDRDASANLEDAIDATQRASHLTRQLLAYAGQARVLVEDVDLNQLLTEHADLLRTAVSKNLDFRLRLAVAPLRVKADSGQLQQIVLSLLANASEAIGDSASGAVIVTTGAVKCDSGFFAREHVIGTGAAGPYAWIEIGDTGPGMDDATLERIWEPFFSTKFVGRGLGLPAVRGIVQAHNGMITIDTAPGTGTRVRVLLPALTASAETPQPEAPTPSRDAAHGTVLIVDDEDGVRDLCERTLTREGMNTITARDGEEAVEVFEANAGRVGLVLLDLTMPRMNGLATFRALRALDPHVAIVLCSGFAEQDAVRGFGRERLDGFLSKPYTRASLLETVARAMAPRGLPHD